MGKKNFTSGLDSLLQPSSTQGPGPGDQPKKKRGRPKTSTRVITKSSQENTKDGETRATFIVKEDLLRTLKEIAYWDRILIKEVVNTALQEYIDRYKKTRPAIKDKPKK